MQPLVSDGPWLHLVGRPDSPLRRQSRDAEDGGSDRPARGDDRIAWALYEAQTRTAEPEPHSAAPARPLSLAEIVALGPPSQGWSLAFRQLKADGRLQEQTLGQVIARFSRRRIEAAALESPSARGSLSINA